MKYIKLKKIFLASLFVSITANCIADGIEFINAEIKSTNAGYKLSTNYTINLTQSLKEALSRGISLYFNMKVKIMKPRWYWLNKTHIRNSQTYKLSYNVLTQEYQVTINDVFRASFLTLIEMVSFLKKTPSWIIANNDDLKINSTYLILLQLSLDGSRLPKPLQVSAIGNDDWKISSGWTRFSYRPKDK